MSTYYPTLNEQIKMLPLYLSSCGIYFEETMVNRDHGYNDFQWILTVSGHGEITIGEETFSVSPNIALFIPSHIPHSYEKTTQHWITHWITFNGEHLHQIFQTLDLTSIELIYLQDNHQELRDVEKVFSLATSNYTKNAFKISTLLYTYIETIYNHYNKGELKNIDNKNNALNIALEYIDQYYMMELTINEIAKFIHISPQYLCRLFKQQLNLRPFEYIKQVRINKSKSMLLQTPTPKIEDIASAVGFQSPSYFTSIFKKTEKITPRQFIKLHQRGV